MNEREATLKGLTQTWVSTGSKKQNQMAFDIVADLQSKGVEAEVIPVEGKTIGTFNAVWRDKSYQKRLRVEKF